MKIILDFSKPNSIAEYQQLIGDRLKFLNVGVVILNAGVLTPGAFVDITPEET